MRLTQAKDVLKNGLKLSDSKAFIMRRDEIELVIERIETIEKTYSDAIKENMTLKYENEKLKAELTKAGEMMYRYESEKLPYIFDVVA